MSKRRRTQKSCIRKVNLALRELKEAKRNMKRRKIILAKKEVARSLLQLGKSLRCIDRLETLKIMDSLKFGHLAGYAGDVWYPQPAAADHPWRTMPKQAMTIHYTGMTLEA
ncbi:hypothetical protein L8C07_20370 [Paenibacillus sp. CMAA1739]|uniref:NAD(P)-dependent oxidoreductase n=1 Tax=Paenibacillus ottowii TaxID=2315729 RepID=UPI00272F95BF|nr:MULTISPECIES: NAD(P)-dependent oxidoreductase [Paenibacillus]MDP1512338.1 hypothetical protein [Paenibacillus ottowii]MEC4568308.1 hypothetical protein [Paenibacillus sp. CMAA1739]